MGADDEAERRLKKVADFIYLYGLVPTKEAENQLFPSMKGFDGHTELFTIPIQDITAIVSLLDSKQYSEEMIQDRMNQDMEWLQEKAFHHHEIVINLAKLHTIIPLKFCTIYQSQERLIEAIQSTREKIAATFKALSGNEEWNVKIYCEDSQLKKHVSEKNPIIEAKKAKISELPKGRQFFELKKIDKLIDSELEKEKKRISENIHNQLKHFVLQGNVKRNWNKDVTGRRDNMTWNGVYLVSKKKVEPFLKMIKQYEEKMHGLSWRFEASGPWPAYHFSSFIGEGNHVDKRIN
jgi:hypothetical protein